MSEPDDPNHIFDRLTARLKPRSAAAIELRQSVYELCAQLWHLESVARKSIPAERDIVQEAELLRREIEKGDWDQTLSAAHRVFTELSSKMAVWRSLSDKERERIDFIRTLRDERTRVRGADFWPHARALVQRGKWSFKGEPAIKAALTVAERYGVRFDTTGPGKPRGKRKSAT